MTAAPTSMGSQRAPLSMTRPWCQPSATDTFPASTSKTRPVTPAASDEPSQATSGATLSAAISSNAFGSSDAAGVTGRVFEVEGGKVSVADGWRHGTVIDKGARWEPIEVGAAVTELLAEAPAPTPVYGAS